MDYDFFISHASADKEEVARPLAELLKKKGLKVWFDDDCIAHGQDVILEKLEEGLQSSEFFIITDVTWKEWTFVEEERN